MNAINLVAILSSISTTMLVVLIWVTNKRINAIIKHLNNQALDKAMVKTDLLPAIKAADEYFKDQDGLRATW